MDLTFSESESAFRDELRAWIKANHPGDEPACEAARSVTASSIQVHGGVGFTWEADLHWFFKRAQLDAAMLDSAAAQRARITRLQVAALTMVGA